MGIVDGTEVCHDLFHCFLLFVPSIRYYFFETLCSEGDECLK